MSKVKSIIALISIGLFGFAGCGDEPKKDKKDQLKNATKVISKKANSLHSAAFPLVQIVNSPQ